MARPEINVALHRAEFWQGKRLESLRDQVRDAQARGDVLGYYRMRDELRELSARRIQLF